MRVISIIILYQIPWKHLKECSCRTFMLDNKINTYLNTEREILILAGHYIYINSCAGCGTWNKPAECKLRKGGFCLLWPYCTEHRWCDIIRWVVVCWGFGPFTEPIKCGVETDQVLCL